MIWQKALHASDINDNNEHTLRSCLAILERKETHTKKKSLTGRVNLVAFFPFVILPAVYLRVGPTADSVRNECKLFLFRGSPW